MSRISFYVSRSADPMARLQIACKLVEKAWQQKLRTHIYTDSSAVSMQMDEYLWTWKDISFLPHALSHQALHNSPEMPITIAQELASGQKADILINLTQVIAEGFEHFSRVVEIIDQRDEFLHAGRKRYIIYREKGYNPDYYKL